MRPDEHPDDINWREDLYPSGQAPSALQRIFRRVYGWASERLYHELAWAYDLVAWLVSAGQWDRWRRQTLDHLVGDRVLEIGFGTGALLVAAARRGFTIWGMDPSPAMHRVAARRMQREGFGSSAHSLHRYVIGEAQAMPFASGTFDTIVSTFPSAYIAEAATLREVRRLVRAPSEEGPPGRFVLTGIGHRTDRGWLRWLLGWVFGGPDGDPVAAYCRFAKALGFRVSVAEDPSARVRVPVLILEAATDSDPQVTDERLP